MRRFILPKELGSTDRGSQQLGGGGVRGPQNYCSARPFPLSRNFFHACVVARFEEKMIMMLVIGSALTSTANTPLGMLTYHEADATGVTTYSAASSSQYTTQSNPEGTRFLDVNKRKAGVGTLRNGLQLKVCAMGTGQQSPLPTDDFTVHFTARTVGEYVKEPIGVKGYTFESTWENKKPKAIKASEALEAWKSVVPYMREGDIFELYSPSELAYGEKSYANGLVKPGDVVIFYLKLVSIQGTGKPYRSLGNQIPVGGCAPEPVLGVQTNDPSVASGSSTSYIAIGAVLLVVGAGAFYYYKQQEKKKAEAAGGVTLSTADPNAPAAPMSPRPLAPGDALPEGWQEMNDQNTGRSYFYNTTNGDVTWTRPTQPASAAHV